MADDWLPVHGIMGMTILFCCFRLTSVEYSQLAGNLEEITALHQNILTALQQCDK